MLLFTRLADDLQRLCAGLGDSVSIGFSNLAAAVLSGHKLRRMIFSTILSGRGSAISSLTWLVERRR